MHTWKPKVIQSTGRLAETKADISGNIHNADEVRQHEMEKLRQWWLQSGLQIYGNCL